jgi:hypothetical protein
MALSAPSAQGRLVPRAFTLKYKSREKKAPRLDKLRRFGGLIGMVIGPWDVVWIFMCHWEFWLTQRLVWFFFRFLAIGIL